MAWPPTGPRLKGRIVTPATSVRVALVAVEEHPRDDPPRGQRLRVGSHGGGATRPVEQVLARGLGQDLRGSLLEVGQVGGEDRLDVRGHPGDVDLGLVAAERGARADGSATARKHWIAARAPLGAASAVGARTVAAAAVPATSRN